jgi:hypothetical protein
MRRAWMAMVLVGGGCHRGLPPAADTELPPLPDETAPDDTDTAVDAPSRCAVADAEPNNAPGLALALPLETRACGDFETPYDADFWTVTVPEPGWLALDLAGYSVGSDAWLSLTASRDGASVGINAYLSLPEAHLVVPTEAGAWLLMARQSISDLGGQGSGPDYFYELRASVTKPPLDWDRTESTAHGTPATAEALPATGVVVYGTTEVSGEADWYRVTLPEGRHRVTLAVQAHALGSPGDFGLEVRAPGEPAVFVSAGPVGNEIDPSVVVDADAGGDLLVRVVEETGQGTPVTWYALHVSVEGA